MNFLRLPIPFSHLCGSAVLQPQRTAEIRKYLKDHEGTVLTAIKPSADKNISRTTENRGFNRISGKMVSILILFPPARSTSIPALLFLVQCSPQSGADMRYQQK